MATWVYDGATWRETTDCWVYDGSVWRNITDLWVYDGTTWRNPGCGATCGTPTCGTCSGCWQDASTACATCTSSQCRLEMRFAHTNCDSSCMNIDGFQSVNGGSYAASLTCRNETCTVNEACNCSIGAYQMTCHVGNKCVVTTNTYQARAQIQRTSDSVYFCTATEASSHTGPCIA